MLVGGSSLLPNFQKRGAWQDLSFDRCLAGKEGVTGQRGGGGGYSFFIKNKLKSEIYTGNFINKNVFLCHK